MKTLLSLAFRNLFRNRRRTAMTLLVASGGIASLLLAGGFFWYLFWGFRESTIRNGVGHLQIFNAEHFRRDETRALENGLASYRDIVATVAKSPHVRGVAPRIEFFGMASNGMKSATYMATAVLPAEEKRMGFETRAVQGRGFSAAAEPRENEAIVGAGLARSMNLKPGSGLTLLAVTAEGALNGIDVDVAGILSTGIKELDDRVLQITLPAAQRLLETEKVTKLVVGLDRTENAAAVQAALARSLQSSGVAIKDWSELSPMYRQMVMMFGGILAFMAVIVFFMVVMSSANTLMMAMFERTREIGTMLAMGTPRSWVLGVFVLEGVLTGLLGAACGLAAGNGLGALINRAGIQMPPPPGNVTGFPLRVLHVPELMIGASVLMVLTLAAASIAPAVRASRLKIVEALAHV